MRPVNVAHATCLLRKQDVRPGYRLSDKGDNGYTALICRRPLRSGISMLEILKAFSVSSLGFLDFSRLGTLRLGGDADNSNNSSSRIICLVIICEEKYLNESYDKGHEKKIKAPTDYRQTDDRRQTDGKGEI